MGTNDLNYKVREMHIALDSSQFRITKVHNLSGECHLRKIAILYQSLTYRVCIGPYCKFGLVCSLRYM